MPLPCFFVIGAAKSGTTALYFYLRQHPEIFLPLEQEPSWFAFADQTLSFTAPDGRPPAVNSQSITNRRDYEALYTRALPGHRLGDVSPVYLYWPGTPERVAAEVPDAKILAILRHPVDRAYSAYMHVRREGREPISDFRAALEAEPGRIAQHCGFAWRYRDLGRYGPQLARWFRSFPRQQFLVATYDEFSADSVAFCQRVQRFLGVDEHFAPRTDIRHNASGIPRSRSLYEMLKSDSSLARAARFVVPLLGIDRMKRIQARLRGSLLERVPLAADIRAELISEWHPDIEDLTSRVDLQLDHWLDPASAQAH